MPKRPVTPPIDDGAKYFTVFHPYPYRPNMEFEEHRRLFTQWMTACLGPRYLRAFYYKPTSPGSVIAEVEETFPDFSKLLGAHKWSEFLQDPKNHGDSVSKVFYCTYNSDRLVQKNGWKRVDIKDEWYRKHSKIASRFVLPYPETHWCEIPRIGNVVQNDLCRPLPQRDFPPPPPPPPAPVVGTPEWTEWKQRQGSTKVVHAWTRGMPPESLNGAPPVTVAGSVPVTRAPSERSTPAAQPLPRQASENATATPLSPPGLPPGLMSAGSSSGTSQTSGSSSRSAWDGTDADDVHADDVHVIIAGENLESKLEALYVDDEEYEEDEVYFTSYGKSIAEEPSLLDARSVQYAAVEPVQVEANLWAGHAAANEDDAESDSEDDEDDLRFHKAPETLCRVHNVVCAKGICKEYAAQKREEAHRMRLEERAKEREEAQKKRSKKNKNKSEASTPSSGSAPGAKATPATVRPPPAHLRAGAPAPGPASARQLPPHLQRGATASSPASPAPGGRNTPTPSHHGDDDDDDDGTQSHSEAGWNTTSGGAPAAAASSRVPAPAKQWEAWGKAPSIRRNNDSWSVSSRSNDDDDAHSIAPSESPSNAWTPSDKKAAAPKTQQKEEKPWGAWGKAPSVSASSVRRNNASWSANGRGEDARSVAASTKSGWGTNSDGPWGSSDAVRATASANARGKGRSVKSGKLGKKTWADEVEDEFNADDARSVAESTASGATWGNVSAGPW